MDPQAIHIPVLLDEVEYFLNIRPDGIYVDATIGLGGHSKIILEKLSSNGLIIGLDFDKYAVEIAIKNLEKYKGKIKIYNDNFINLEKILEENNIKNVDGIIADLGISSLQIIDSNRGFSYNNDVILDMRMNTEYSLTARDILNNFSFNDLKKIFREYAEIRNPGSLVSKIIEERQKKSINTSFEFIKIIKKFSHSFSVIRKCFQALRIYINNELDNLEKFIDISVKLLKPGARLLIISFHSLEDRIVKHKFMEFQKNTVLKIITKKPIIPDENEIRNNPKSKSAKLRVAEKI